MMQIEEFAIICGIHNGTILSCSVINTINPYNEYENFETVKTLFHPHRWFIYNFSTVVNFTDNLLKFHYIENLYERIPTI